MAGSLRRLRAHQRVGRRAKGTVLSSENERSSTPDASIGPCRDKTELRGPQEGAPGEIRADGENGTPQGRIPSQTKGKRRKAAYFHPKSRKKGIPEASEILQDNLAFINALEDQETRLKICEASPKTRDTVVSRALQLKTMAEDEMTNGSRDTKRTDRRP